MAKKRTGVIGAMGNLFRWTIYGLAAVLLFAIYLGWSGQEGEEIAAAPEVAAPVEPVEEQVADESATQDAEVAPDEIADQVTEGVEAAAEEVQAELDAAVEEIEDKAQEAAETLESGLAEAADELRDAAGGLAAAVGDALEGVDEALKEVDGTVDLPAALATFAVPGDEATYAIRNAVRRDDGTIEITTERTGADGTTQSVTRLMSCAPLASGVISEGDGARTEQPELERLVLGTPEASVAAMACGVLR